MKIDGHVHSPYCPHGSGDSFEEYIKQAITLEIEELTFTEHAPLPDGFIDPTPDRDSGMERGQLLDYFQELALLKERYKEKITIKTGLEVDYIEGFETETKNFLNKFGKYLDDSILSVHFIRHENEWHCIDFSDEMFKSIANRLGSVDAVYSSYYDTLENSIAADLGDFKPKRIGHITLVHKFQQRFLPKKNYDQKLYSILDKMNKQGYELDYNGAGAIKPLCLEPYPPERFVKYALHLGIPVRYGSDAHQASDLGQGYDTCLAEAFTK
ncbi:histidinol-phosphatase HisJ [Peribacillus loiseleuriae]|uniref:Histidinol-phosphatase n=1 Tax=Peribacillus loiseleuriae TaxID=1679170 RepID=A0A0K9GX47_9BACI|nr:histidinol-phosphatase HisJ [Peribacillus loiseleuriae]KMY51269.1 histidinol phosphatase [Peribacillus loiseleuriae]